eukprot:2081838-Pyramimonas_sp.AAC.1
MTRSFADAQECKFNFGFTPLGFPAATVEPVNAHPSRVGRARQMHGVCGACAAFSACPCGLRGQNIECYVRPPIY